MRDILFRGKRVSPDHQTDLFSVGQWLFGSLLVYGDRRVIAPQEDIIDNEHRSRLYWSLIDRLYEVDPETVGQYTGLKDKNGVMIFEGDITSIPFEEDRMPWEPNCTYYENAEVYFSEERHAWYVRFRNGTEDDFWLWEYDDSELQVIGNIHDNPELVSGAYRLEALQ